MPSDIQALVDFAFWFAACGVAASVVMMAVAWWKL